MGQGGGGQRGVGRRAGGRGRGRSREYAPGRGEGERATDAPCSLHAGAHDAPLDPASNFAGAKGKAHGWIEEARRRLLTLVFIWMASERTATALCWTRPVGAEKASAAAARAAYIGMAIFFVGGRSEMRNEVAKRLICGVGLIALFPETIADCGFHSEELGFHTRNGL